MSIARLSGVELYYEETGAGVEVTSARATYRAESVVVTTGAWAAPTLGSPPWC